jgi:hypothetical protein
MVIEAILFMFILNTCNSKYSREIEIANQNILALNGKASELELKNGELITANESYILQLDELEGQFNITKNEAKELKKQLGSSLAYISYLESNVHFDTIITIKDTTIYINNGIESKFIFDNGWIDFKGLSIYNGNDINTNIYDLNVKVPLQVGLTNDYTIFVKSTNPYIHFTSIEGAVIDKSNIYPKKKRFNYGLQAGAGFNYGIINKQLDFGPYFGFGVEYNF